jgi:DNA repair exonuclease SbcCD ATPase subunit
MNIKLSLKNFKKYKQFELELPSTGFIRLHGVSGAGKTSILQAITYALYGKCNGSVNTWNEKSSRVELNAFGLNIVRTRGPNEVVVNDVVFSDDADNLIASTLNMNRLEFDLSSYVKQQSENSILALSPAEQLNVIHQLAFKGKSPNEVKDKLKASLNTTTGELISVENLLLRIEASIKETQDQVLFEESRTTAPSKSLDEVRTISSQATAKISSLNQSLANLTKEHEGLKAIQSTDTYGKLKRCYDFISRFPDELLTKQNWLESNPPPENEQYLSDKITDATDRKRILIQEKAKIASTIESLKNSEKYEATRSKVLADFSKFYGAVSPLNIEASSKSDLKALAVSSESMSDYISAVSLPSDSEQLEAALSEKSALIKEVTQELSDLEHVRRKNIERHADIKRVKGEISTLHDHHNIAKDRIEKYKSVPSESEVLSRLESISIEKENILNVIQTLNSVLSDTRLESSKHEQYAKGIERISTLNKRLSSIKTELEEKALHVSKLRVKIENLNRLMELSVKCGLDVVSQVLDEINLRAKYWLDQLFDGEVSANLMPFKKLKSKEEVVDKISLEVFFNGTKLSDYNDDLSGGQRVRLRTAFSLAMSDMFNSPILILDESFSGVDNATVLDCLEAIHPIAQRKLVLVIEHGASSYEFDKTIEAG